MKQLKKTKRPVVLTVNGKAAAVVQDAEAYQRLLDIAARADAEEGIRQGLDDVAHVVPARQERYLTRFVPAGMPYRVNITPRAERDLASLYREIHAGESDAALKWYRGLKEAVLRLDEQPNRCPVTPEKRNSAISSTATSLTLSCHFSCC